MPRSKSVSWRGSRGLFLGQMLHLGHELFFLLNPLVQYGSAMGALEQTRLFQLVQIVANGGGGNIEILAKIRNHDFFLLIQHFENFSLAFLGEIERALLRFGQGIRLSSWLVY